MDAIRTLLETQPLFTLFLTVALGYLVGEINIKGFSLGSGAVLFVGLAIGGFAPKAAPPALVGTLGLLLFLYGVGIQYGAQFFKGLTSVDGLKANAAAALGVIGAGFVSLALLPLRPSLVPRSHSREATACRRSSPSHRGPTRCSTPSATTPARATPRRSGSRPSGRRTFQFNLKRIREQTLPPCRSGK